MSHIRYETPLQNAQKHSTEKKGDLPLQSELGHRYHRPESHLHGNPSIRAYPFAHELRRQLGTQERESEKSVPKIIIYRAELVTWQLQQL